MPVLALSRLEWAARPRRPFVMLTSFGVIGVIASHVLLSFVPDRVISFMRAAFLLNDFGSVLLLNDLMAVYFPTFFLGAAGALSVVLIPREERRLEIMLAKPIAARAYVVARALPVLAEALLCGVVLSVVVGIATAAHPGDASDAATPLAALGAGLWLTGLALASQGLLFVLSVRLVETFQALAAASLLFLMTTMPTAVLIYRPDAYEGRTFFRDAVVGPSLLWHAQSVAMAGPLVCVLGVALALVGARYAGALLDRAR